MKIRNVGAGGPRVLEDGQVVPSGATVEVDDDLGRTLCEQTDRWQQVKATKTTKEG